MGGNEGTITILLQRARSGEAAAANELFERVYDDLRRLARGKYGHVPGRGLEGTALVNAACERLLGRDALNAEDRRHFFFLLGRAMHDVLVEEARARAAEKRGGDRRQVPLVDFAADGASHTFEMLDLHAALEELRRADPDAAQVVSLRFFGNRTLEEAAEMMGVTFAVARRHWDYAKAWLSERLSRTNGRGE